MKVINVCFILLCIKIAAGHEEGHHHHHGHRHLQDEKIGSDGGGGDGDRGRCFTKDPDESDHAALDRAREFAEFRSKRKHGTGNENTVASTYTIPVCFHNPEYPSAWLNRVRHRYISNEQLQVQLDQLNLAYSGASCCDTAESWCHGECSVDTGIRFVMATVDSNGKYNGTTNSTSDPNACITRRRGFYWMSISPYGGNIKRALHIGDESVLNVYYIRPSAIPGLSTILGFSTLPWAYDRSPKLDGVVIEPTTIKGGVAKNYNEGDTLAHEVGHWFGLYHTFQNGCSAKGDSISDTPAEARPYKGCTPSQQPDTCPLKSGLDPIFNFMDYSDDVCMYQFTPEQATVMRNNIALYRVPENQQLRQPTEMFSGSASEEHSLTSGMAHTFTIDVPLVANVTCNATRAHGNLDLFMNWNASLANFDCQSQTTAAIESCTIGPNNGTAYGLIFAVTDVDDFQVTCEII